MCYTTHDPAILEGLQVFKVILDLLVYRIEPFNSVCAKQNKRGVGINCNVRFISKGVEMLNLPRLFHKLKPHASLCKIKAPLITYKYNMPISGYLYNYKETVTSSDADITCKCEEYPDFIDRTCGHVVTGDMNVFAEPKLSEICRKGMSYREPKTIDLSKVSKSVMEDVKEFLKIWSSKEAIPLKCFDEWFEQFKCLLKEEVESIKNRYKHKLIKYSSVFNDVSVKKELEFFQQHFVLCPVDKAAKNLAVICKRYYLDTLYSECDSSCERFDIVSPSESVNIVQNQQKYLVENKVKSEYNELPYMFLLPKFHKKELSTRFVISYSSCVIKPLAQNITLGLKAVQFQTVSYCRMMRILTGIKRDWVIHSNQPILDCIDGIKSGRNITTYDFSTLYTNFSLSDIEIALKSVIKLAFKHSKKSHISIYKKSFKWTNSPRVGTYSFSETGLMEAIVWLLKNSYFTVCKNVFRQLIGVPIGVNCGPLIANLTLFYYENKFLDSQYKVNYRLARKLNNTFRLIDDITSINSDGMFEDNYRNIYPSSLILKKENNGDRNADVLDLSITVNNISDQASFLIKVYDKRDDFKFDVCNFQYIESNISLKCAYGIFKSQLIRYFRICSEIKFFTDRTKMLSVNLKSKGYSMFKLQSIFKKFTENAKFKAKYNIVDDAYLDNLDIFK